MRIDVLGLSDPAWPDCLRTLQHDFYHLPAYVAVEAWRIQAQPGAFLAEDGKRRMFVPFLRRSCAELFPDAGLVAGLSDVTSPYGYPGLLLSEDARQAPDFTRAALEALRHTLSSQGICSAFLRQHPLLSGDFRFIFPADVLTHYGDTVAVDLTLGDKVLWHQIREGHQWTINKGRRLGFTARMIPLAECLDVFVILYRETMDRVKAKETYYFRREYFERLAEMPQHVHCCAVESEGTVIAACILFECAGIVQAHLGGTRTDFLSRSPFHLALHHAMFWAKSRGNRYLHLGGGVGGANDSLLQFKAGFSPRRFPLLAMRLIVNEPSYRRLVELRAQACGVPPATLAASSFFPLYRNGETR